MNKIRIKSTPIFKQVAAVIGEEGAQIELAIAYHDYRGGDKFEFGARLILAFNWSCTKQGYKFWKAIHNGVNPCSN